MFQAGSCLLIGKEPGEDVLVGVEPALLVCHVVARARLLVQLGQAIGRLFEAVLERNQVHLCDGLLRLMLR